MFVFLERVTSYEAAGRVVHRSLLKAAKTHFKVIMGVDGSQMERCWQKPIVDTQTASGSSTLLEPAAVGRHRGNQQANHPVLAHDVVDSLYRSCL